MAKVVLFDLYNTLLIDEKFCFEDGLRYLYETYFTGRCTWEDLCSYSAELWEMYDEKRSRNAELVFIQDEVPLFFDRFGVEKEYSDLELDYQLLRAMETERLLPDTEHTLKKLFESGMKMYILSNSIYLGSSNQRMVESFGIMKYFGRLYSSADFGWRKPDTRFFEHAISEILEENPHVAREDIVYVGNDYQTDVKGGTEAGLKTVWYNWETDDQGNCRRDTEGYEPRQIQKFSEIVTVLEGMQ